MTMEISIHALPAFDKTFAYVTIHRELINPLST